jgi:hypothetical protein
MRHLVNREIQVSPQNSIDQIFLIIAEVKALMSLPKLALNRAFEVSVSERRNGRAKGLGHFLNGQ